MKNTLNQTDLTTIIEALDLFLDRANEWLYEAVEFDYDSASITTRKNVVKRVKGTLKKVKSIQEK